MDRKQMLATFAARHRKKRHRAEDGTTVGKHFYDQGLTSKIPGVGPATRKPTGYPN